MIDLNDLFYFTQIVEHGGFSAAARHLDMPKSKISRRLALLEERLGVRLVQRSTRQFVVTDVGHEYYRHCQAMLVEAQAAEESVQRSRAEPQGIIRLSCPIGLFDALVADMLTDFMVRYPLIRIHAEGANRRVDIIGEGFDVALRVRFPPLEDSGLILKTLSDSPQRLVASPAFLKRYGPFTVPADLAKVPSLGQGPDARSHEWELFGPDGTAALVHHAPCLLTDQMLALRMAAIKGLGVVQLPTLLIAQSIRDGQLVDAIPGWAPRTGIVHAVYPSRRGLLPSVQTLLEFLTRAFQRQASVP
ncbi:LysR substrate-binding domain-containing protein [Achromobacter marplatensis]|uniref:LysR substrate-binding domain-containing protein n=1 Tax=Achromobacter marplatensis TaxID=470868 RepID=UPI0039F6EE71